MSDGGPGRYVTLLGRRGRQLGRLVFGDRSGVILFLVAVVAVGLFWRAGTFITDTQTLIRALEAVSRGNLHIDIVGPDHFTAPGSVVSDGVVYGRSYGQIVLSLPALWLVDAMSTVANLRVGLIAIWHLALLVLVSKIGQGFDTGRLASIGGSVVVLTSFALNVSIATSLSSTNRYLLALQVTTIVAAGLLAVLTYRFIKFTQNRRLGLVAGYAAVLVLPIGFWAQIPKRHVIVATIVMGILYAFARSRSAESRLRVPPIGAVPVYRAGAYALVGLLAWINAAEGIFVLLALVLVDLPTAPSNDVRTLGILVTVFLVSLVPFFLTNWFITGDLLKPPLTLTPADRASPQPTDVLFDSSAGSSSGGGQQPGSNTFPGAFIVHKLVWLSALIATQIVDSIHQLLDSTAVVRTWIRSGSLEGVASRAVPQFRAVNLTVLESVPILGSLLAVAGTTYRRRSTIFDHVTSVDALAAAVVAAFVLLYMQALPNHAQITIRYLVPVYPVMVYLSVRQRIVVRLLTELRTMANWAYAATVLLGTQLLLAYVVAAGLTVSEAVQLHAVLGLAIAGILGLTVLASQFDERVRPVAALAVGVAAAAGTAFILLTGFAYFSFVGQYVLPVSQSIGELIALA